MKLEQADALFMHSTPSPIFDSSICCLGERNIGECPVPIINKFTESILIKGNKNSELISLILEIEISLKEVLEIKHGLFNLTCESDNEDSSNEIMVFIFAFC